MNNDPFKVLEQAPEHLRTAWEKKNLDGKTFKELKADLERARKFENSYFVLLFLMAVIFFFAVSNTIHASRMYITVLDGAAVALLAITWTCLIVYVYRQHALMMRDTNKYTDAILKFADSMRKLNPLDYVDPPAYFYNPISINQRLIACECRVLELEAQFLQLCKKVEIVDVESIMCVGHELLQARQRVDDMFAVLPDFNLDFGAKEAIFRLAEQRIKEMK